MFESIYESQKVYLKLFSPVHIGNEQGKITRFEFLNEGNYVYPISEEKLSNFLLEKNLVDDYVQEIENQGRDFNLLNFLRNKRVNLDANVFEFLSNRRKIKALKNESNVDEFHPLIRDGFTNPYIPGTSIKGAIRTAILYCYLKKLKSENANAFNSYANEIHHFISNRKNKKEFDEKIIQTVFQNFNIMGKNKSPNTDWLRMLHVSDAYPVNLNETILIKANILKKEDDGFKFKTENNNRNTAIWIECFPIDTVFNFNITFDKKLLEKFNNFNALLPKSINDIFECLNEWSKDIIEFEESFASDHALGNWYKDKNLNFRLGFGSGMVSTTIVLLFDEDLRKKIRNYAGLNRGAAIAPKSRRVWNYNNKFIPFGWGLIKITPFEITTQETSNSEVVVENQIPRNKSDNEKQLQEKIITWETALLSWNPGRNQIIAEFGNEKTSSKIITDRSFVPEPLHKKLFDKKEKVKAKVTVKKIGNLVEIVKIEKI